MLLRLSIAALAVACATWTAAGAEFPYTAYIVSDDVYIRSGPGDNYYPSLKMDQGEAVEVYRHDPGGWYAIRPPEGSFSWVAAEYLEPQGENLATVTADRVVARVGSQLSDIRDVIQVRLDRDEVVEVLEAKRFGSGPAAQTWYKIAPPAGEFRWVFGKYVSRERPVAERQARDASRNLLVRDRRESDVEGDHEAELIESEGDDAETFERQAAAERTFQRPARQAQQAERRDADEPPVRGRVPTSEDFEKLGVKLEHKESALPDDGGYVAPEVMKEEIEDIELSLSAMLAEEPSVWAFDPLVARCQRVLANAQTAVERGKAEAMLRKIERFTELQDRYQQVNRLRTEIDERDHRLEAASPLRDQAAAQRTVATPTFDGTGRLTRVISRQLGAPQYALVDETGAVKVYVTPAPGVNLRYYEGRDVGIHGTRGYAPDLGAGHLTAKRVTPLWATERATVLR